MGTADARAPLVTRKLIILIAALLVPGGLFALVGAFLVHRLARTARGQRFLLRARRRIKRFRRWAKPIPVRPELPVELLPS
jgi:hypothetical protein